MAALIDPTSAAFLIGESKNQPMHVAGLQLFEPPPGAAPDFIRSAYERAINTSDLQPLFRRKPGMLVPRVGPWVWTEDHDVDLEFHVRHSALPQPGRVRELLELVSRLHGSLMTRDRPMWETHVIEGLADGRFAIYTKLHHSLVDGISAMRLLQRSMSTDPDERDMPFPFELRRDGDRRSRSVAPPDVVRTLRSGLALSAEAAGMPSALISTLSRGAKGEVSAVSFGAPRSVFNVPISSARRFAADSWPLERLLAVGKATGTTLNDVVLAMCGGALRAYLLERSALPDESLVSMVPVGLKSRSATTSGGNAVGSVMVKLETQTGDPGVRLAAISRSMQSGKDALAAMSPAQIVAVSGIGMLPALALPALGFYGARPFNLVISNVPGSREVQYFNGARLTDTYPVSIPLNGYALNITCNSYADSMGFGLTGCRRAVPSLQRLLVHLEDELAALEVAAGVR